MDDATVSLNSMKLHMEDTSEDTEIHPEDQLYPHASSEDNLSYLGRHLPHLIVEHPDWTNPQYYEHLSTQTDFPGDGSVTRKALRQKVSKLRKKLKANGGYLIDPLNRNSKLWVCSNDIFKSSTTSKGGDDTTSSDRATLTSAANPDGTCRSSSRFKRKERSVECKQKSEHASSDEDDMYNRSYLQRMVDVRNYTEELEDSEEDSPAVLEDSILKMTGHLGGFFAAASLDDEEKGIAAGIKEVSRYLTMIRSNDGKEAARFLHCAQWLGDRNVILARLPVISCQKMFERIQLALNITDDDIKIWEAVTAKDKKKARDILEKLVHEDRKRVKNCTGEKKALPYLLLADMYFDGSGEIPCNKEKAEQLYLIAAERGNSIAAYKISCELEERGIESQLVNQAYMNSVKGYNADAMHGLAVLQLQKQGNTFDNCKSARYLLRSGAKLNTSIPCKERYVREMIRRGDFDKVKDELWQLIVAEDSNACFHGGCYYLTQGDLKLSDALFRRSADLGQVNVNEYLERVKSVRMSVEGKKYKEEIPQDYIQKRTEWITAREDIITALANSFADEFKERTDECFLDEGMSDSSDVDDGSTPSSFSDRLSDEDVDQDEEQDEVETNRGYSLFNLAKVIGDMALKMVSR